MVTGQLGRLQRDWVPAIALSSAEYVEAVRDVERRIQKAEEQSEQELPAVAQPAGVPATYAEYAKLMFDLMALAFQCDLTRVSTFLSRPGTERTDVS